MQKLPTKIKHRCSDSKINVLIGLRLVGGTKTLAICHKGTFVLSILLIFYNYYWLWYTVSFF